MKRTIYKTDDDIKFVRLYNRNDNFPHLLEISEEDFVVSELIPVEMKVGENSYLQSKKTKLCEISVPKKTSFTQKETSIKGFEITEFFCLLNNDGLLSLYDLEALIQSEPEEETEKKKTYKVLKTEDRVNCFNVYKDKIVFANIKGRITYFSLNAAVKQESFSIPDTYPTSSIMMENENEIITASNVIQKFDLRENKKKPVFTLVQPKESIIFTFDILKENFIVSGNFGGTINVYDMKKPMVPLWSVQMGDSPIWKLKVNYKSQTVSGHEDGSLLKWTNFEKSKFIVEQKLKYPVHDLDVMRIGKVEHLVYCYENGDIFHNLERVKQFTK